MDAYTAFDMDIRAVDPAALVDICDVKVNTALPKRERCFFMPRRPRKAAFRAVFPRSHLIYKPDY